MSSRSKLHLCANVCAVLLLIVVAGWQFVSPTSLRLQSLLKMGEICVPDPAEPGGQLCIGSLQDVEPPLPSSLDDFVKDRTAAVALGKALFWDMQMGSNGVTACASCHFHAGADSRTKNQLRPAGPSSLDDVFSFGGPNYDLQGTDFPFPKTRNEVVSSQGAFHGRFLGIFDGEFIDHEEPLPDPVFNVNGVPTRRVEPRNTPTVINSVFFFRNFWDGRANNIFNGVDPFGRRNQEACVWFNVGGSLSCEQIELENASLASQAVGPPLSELEASAIGRTFPDIGKKLLGLRPLARQRVHPDDSILGPLSRGDYQGLRMTYREIIQEAFHDNLWSDRLTPQGYSQLEANFSLYWGIAIMLYEATLISDDTPFDRFVDGDSNALTERQKKGLEVFMDKGKCINCHGGPEFSNAASHLQGENQEQGLVERMVMGNDQVALYDNGFYNIGVRPTAEDLGVGGIDPFGNPLSFTRQYLDMLRGLGAPDPFQVDPCTFDVLIPNCGTSHPDPDDENVAVDGAHKVPTLRNIELTAPYFRNGGQATLMQVVDFYDRGGDFRHENQDDLDPDIRPLGLSQEEKEALVDFMLALTDPRVKHRKAPFDHPQLFIPNGHVGDHVSVAEDENGRAVDDLIEITAIGRNGGTPLLSFHDKLGLDHYVGAGPETEADLELTKTASAATAEVGAEVVYTLTVSNHGPDKAYDIFVDDLLPSGVSLISSEGDGSFVNRYWDLRGAGGLEMGDSFSIRLKVRVLAVGSILNSARILSARSTDPVLSNNEDSVSLKASFPSFWKNANRDAGGISSFLYVSDAGKGTSSGILFAGTDEGGVFRSLDGGVNWFPTSLSDVLVRAIAYDPISKSIFVGTYGDGVYRSDDGGNTFVLADGEDINDSELSSREVLALIVNTLHPDASHGGDVFAGTDNGGVFKSKNGGEDWEPFTGSGTKALKNKIVRSFALIPGGHSHGDWLFAATHGGGVYRTRTKDDEWQAVNSGLENLVVPVLYAINGHVFAGTNKGIYRTSNPTDAVPTWTLEPGTDGLVVRSIISNSQGDLFAGTDGSYVYKKAAGGTTWTESNVGIQDRTVYALAAVAGNSIDVLYAGTQDHGVHVSHDNAATWTQTSNVTLNVEIQALSFNASGTRIFGGTYGFGIVMAQPASSPQYLNWIRVNNGLNHQFIYALEQMEGRRENVLFAGSWGGGVYRSTNDGEQWFWSGLPGAIIHDLAVHNGIVYAATDRGAVARSIDEGQTWQQIGVASTSISALGIDPRNGWIYAGTNGAGAYRSTDNGISWTATGLDGKYIFDFAIDNGTYPSTIYAATATGVMVSGNRGETWHDRSNGLTTTEVRTITTTWPGGPVVAGTFGGGLFTYDLNAQAWIRSGLPDRQILAFAVHPSTGEAFAASGDGGLFRNYPTTTPTAVEENPEEPVYEIPTEVGLSQNYPNPFNPTTTIEFTLPETQHVRLSVYDLVGRRVAVLAEQAFTSGSHSVRFDAAGLASGVYIYRLETPTRAVTKQMLLMK